MLDMEVTKRLSDKKSSFTLDISIRSNADRLVLFGPSGSGKTLTLQMIAGLAKPNAGHIIAGNKVMFDSSAHVNLPPQKRKIGYVFQDYALFPHLTLQ